MKLKIWGWVLLMAGALGIIISAVIGSDWPMYSCMILASGGAVLVIHRECRRSRSRPQVR
jgi:hypothetical protein